MFPQTHQIPWVSLPVLELQHPEVLAHEVLNQGETHRGNAPVGAVHVLAVV